ncbi:hypothetical protein AYJ54_21170 [Bradyrhizobium centrolobii]|uniref:Uncharacterized protein n=1 Tax=Bradyrhizobium centrolobii TaxID=1505087 RepID=A0A176YHS1_9BRAD|nr:tetratricopeptide repeat protein [Bradyrhizobium centrolobii]OAF06185.1 hypothetical protein AYJ54_21170 [Bradyrhizobium centrolobii]
MIGRVGRTLSSAAATLAMITLISPAAANSADERKCSALTQVSPDERIAACTSLLQPGKYGRQSTARVYFNRGSANHAKGEYGLAIADYSAAIEIDPTNKLAYYCRAVAYYHLGNLDRAHADFDRAIQLNPRNRIAYYARGLIYSRKGDYDRAIGDYTRAVQLGSQAEAIQKNHNKPNRKGGDLVARAAGDDVASELDAIDGRIFLARGATYNEKGDIDHAIDDYDEAIRINAKDKDAFDYRASAYNAKGDFARAIVDSDRAIQLDPEDARAYRSRAIAHFQSGSLAKALADIDRSTSLDPKDAYAALWREIVSKRSGTPGELDEAAKLLDTSRWPAPIVRFFLGEMTFEALRKSAQDDSARKTKGQVCEANFYSAELALQRGSKEDALRLLELAAADCPKTFVESRAADVELKALRANP